MSVRAPRSFLRASLPLVLTAGLAASGAHAATLLEGSATGADFSDNWRASTVVTRGAETVSGVWSGGNDFDFLAFTDLNPGAQTLTLTFAPTGPQGWSYSAGGMVLFKTTPYKFSAWEGTALGSVSFGYWNQSKPQTLTLSLDRTFGGALYLGLYGTHGTLGYTISAAGNAARPEPTPPVVPTPVVTPPVVTPPVATPPVVTPAPVVTPPVVTPPAAPAPAEPTPVVLPEPVAPPAMPSTPVILPEPVATLPDPIGAAPEVGGISAVPLPHGIVLLGSILLGSYGFARRRRA